MFILNAKPYMKAWNKRIINENLANKHIPLTKKQAYDIQYFYEKSSKSDLLGWKIAATSVEGQKHIGVDGPIAGRLIRERFYNSGSSVSIKSNQMKVVEAEFAFKLLRDIYPRSLEYSIKDVTENLESVYPAIEIPDSRFLDFHKIGANLLIADNACAGDYVLGSNFKNSFREIDFINFKVNCYKNNKFAEEGVGSNVLGSPLLALKWFINEMKELKINLKKGQIILTGTSIKPLLVEVGDQIKMDFGKIGSVSCNLT